MYAKNYINTILYVEYMEMLKKDKRQLSKVGTVPECRAMCSLDGELLGSAAKCPGGGLTVGSYAHA